MDLFSLIKNKKAKVAVIGLGYVGLPTAVEIARAGYKVSGIDVKKQRVDSVNKGISYILDVPSEELKKVVKSKGLIAFDNYQPLKKADIILICVPTPLDKNKVPDVSYIISTAEEIARFLRKGQLVVLESSTYPGTTREIILPRLEENKLKVGRDFFLAFSPERIDPGNKKYTFKDVSRVVGGITKKCTQLATEFYRNFIKAGVMSLSSTETAEMTKILENTFRLVNISMINELALFCGKMGIDIWEVIEAAKTKPYGFMPFYPSPKIGGHCFDSNQILIVEKENSVEFIKIADLYQHVYQNTILTKAALKNKTKIPALVSASFPNSSALNFTNSPDFEISIPNNLKILSYDLKTQKPVFGSVKMLTKREENNLYAIQGAHSHKLKVTDKHPVVVYKNNKFSIKFAKDLKGGENLVVLRNLPSTALKAKRITIDLIDEISKVSPELLKRIKMRPTERKVEELESILRKIGVDWYKRSLFRQSNSLPASFFLKNEKNLGLKRNEIYLCMGQGPSSSKIRNMFEIDKDFARLIGYYLGEGCLTEEKTTKRIRFTFNSNEKFYIADLKQILNKKNIKYSCYQDKNWQSFHVKVSSEILGVLFKNILSCGKNCYEMKIPSQLFLSNKTLRKEVLAGILRGEGGVYHVNKKSEYLKNHKKYFHNSNSICVSFYSSSPTLFEQVQLILHEMGIFPRLCRKREQLLEIGGSQNLKKISEIFGGEKEKKIDDYIKNVRKEINYKKVKIYQNFITLKIEKIIKEPVKEVFSLEVEPTNTLITTSGIIAHNCIPLDPFYLSYKAKEYNFWTRFIELAGEINEQMPHYVITRMITVLNRNKKPLKGSRILVWGVTYKKDIADPREAAVYEIVPDLLKKGAKVDYFDPFIPKIELRNGRLDRPQVLRSIKYNPACLKNYDLVLILTDHSGFDYNELAKKSKLVVDTRNAIKSRKYKNVSWF